MYGFLLLCIYLLHSVFSLCSPSFQIFFSFLVSHSLLLSLSVFLFLSNLLLLFWRKILEALMKLICYTISSIPCFMNRSVPRPLAIQWASYSETHSINSWHRHNETHWLAHIETIFFAMFIYLLYPTISQSVVLFAFCKHNK